MLDRLKKPVARVLFLLLLLTAAASALQLGADEAAAAGCQTFEIAYCPQQIPCPLGCFCQIIETSPGNCSVRMCCID